LVNNGSEPDVAEKVTPAASGAATSSGPRRIDSPPAEPVDLLSVAGGSTLKRLAPVVGVVIVLVVVRARRRSRRTRVEALSSYLPDVRIADVRSAARRGRRRVSR
jgi:hypothetical protein